MKRIQILFISFFITSLLNAQQLKSFEQEGKWGFKDAAGNIAIPAQYGMVDYFTSEGFAKVGNKEGSTWKYGIIDQTGKLVIPIAYNKFGRNFYSGLILTLSNGKWGYLNKAGQAVVPFKYEDAASFSEGLAAVKLNGMYGFIDASDVVKIPFIYSNVSDFKNSLSKVRLNGKSGFIDKSGKHVTEIKYDEIVYGHMDAMLYAVRLNGKYAVLNRQGIELTPFIYDDIKPNFDNKTNYMLVRTGAYWGMVNDKGTLVLPNMYDDLDFIDDKLLNAASNRKWGIINTSGTVVLPFTHIQRANVTFYRLPQGTYIEDNMRKSFYLEGDGIRISKYEHIDEEADERRAVYYKNKAGFINSKGQEIIPMKYDSVGMFDKGIAIVASGGKFGLVDTLGKELTPVKYNYIGSSSEGFMLVGLDNKWGYVDASGKEVVPLVYEGGAPFSEGLAAVVVNKKVGFINKYGRIVIEPQFEGIVQVFKYGEAIVVKEGKQITISKNGKPLEH